MERLGRRFSRRKFLGGVLGAGAIVVGADRILANGVMMDPPPFSPEKKKISTESLIRFGSARRSLEVLKSSPKIDLRGGSSVYYNRWGELIFQHDDAKFDPEREYNFLHRSGNRRYMVDKAITMGVNGFDIDANDIGSKILAEHGIVGVIDLGIISLGGVFDADEEELRTRIPRSISSIIDYIGDKSDPADPYILEIQLKRGKFDNYSTLSDMIGAICRNRLPAKIFSGEQQSIDNLYNAAQRYSENSMTV